MSDSNIINAKKNIVAEIYKLCNLCKYPSVPYLPSQDVFTISLNENLCNNVEKASSLTSIKFDQASNVGDSSR
jgi:hypothetical protein